MGLCSKCELLRIFHFFHDNGNNVVGPLAGDAECNRCFRSVPHTEHDKSAFNVSKALAAEE